MYSPHGRAAGPPPVFIAFAVAAALVMLASTVSFRVGVGVGTRRHLDGHIEDMNEPFFMATEVTDADKGGGADAESLRNSELAQLRGLQAEVAVLRAALDRQAPAEGDKHTNEGRVATESAAAARGSNGDALAGEARASTQLSPTMVAVGELASATASGSPAEIAPQYMVPVTSATSGEPPHRVPGALEKACVDGNKEVCSERAAAGECSTQASDMYHRCPVTCGWRDNITALADSGVQAALRAGMPTVAPRDVQLALWGAQYRPTARTGVALAPEPAIHVVSWKPRIFVVPNFMSDEECDHFIALARPAMVYTEGPGHNLVGDKTMLHGWLRKDPVVQAVEHRIARLSRLPIEHQENFLMIQYHKGGINKQHHDPLAVTVVIHLQDPEGGGLEGGETWFPQGIALDASGEEAAEGSPESQCDCAGEKRSGVSVKPRKGTAVMFHSTNADGTSDGRGLHAGCDVVAGTKWTAIKWIKKTPMTDA